MTTGLSGTFAINSVNLTLPPSSHRWVPRDSQGFDGNGHPIYAGDRDYEMVWELLPPEDWVQILNAYNAVQNTGTVAWDLPKFDSNDYRFYTYSGTTLSEPQMDDNYFMGYRSNVRITIHNIRT